MRLRNCSAERSTFSTAQQNLSEQKKEDAADGRRCGKSDHSADSLCGRDVKGSHGASIGQLDEETPFYMQARDFGGTGIAT